MCPYLTYLCQSQRPRYQVVKMQIYKRRLHELVRRTITTRADSDVTPPQVLIRLQQTLAPLSLVEYSDQLKLKENWSWMTMRRLSSIMMNSKMRPSEKLMVQIEALTGYACDVEPIRPSPVSENYRNKENYVVGTGVDGNPKTVGFFIRPGKLPNMDVASGYLRSHNKRHRYVALAYQDLIRRSEIPACGRTFIEGGHWNRLTVRSTEDGQLMASVSFHPQDGNRTIIDSGREQFANYFVHGPGQDLGITSLYFQECAHKIRCSHDQAPFQLLHGMPYIEEELLGYKFQISPDSFFQVNKAGAEVLYQTLAELCGSDKDVTTLLDICCGTGTIGTVLSKHVKRVIGIESKSQAVEDAKANSLRNGVTNADWHCGHAEKLLRLVTADLDPSENVVAVLNPGRGGLGWKVPRALRKCGAIRKVIYVSCKPVGRATFNFIQLCQQPTEKQPGLPFVPTKVIPIDMFPHCKHVEMVIVFER